MMQASLFARVVERQGWDVELIDPARQADPETHNFPDRASAFAYAAGRGPAWIEVGEVVPATDDAPQHHRWTTLRRSGRGKYDPSPLVWGSEVAQRKGD